MFYRLCISSSFSFFYSPSSSIHFMLPLPQVSLLIFWTIEELHLQVLASSSFLFGFISTLSFFHFSSSCLVCYWLLLFFSIDICVPFNKGFAYCLRVVVIASDRLHFPPFEHWNPKPILGVHQPQKWGASVLLWMFSRKQCYAWTNVSFVPFTHATTHSIAKIIQAMIEIKILCYFHANMLDGNNHLVVAHLLFLIDNY